jgi:hypothetical protein
MILSKTLNTEHQMTSHQQQAVVPYRSVLENVEPLKLSETYAFGEFFFHLLMRLRSEIIENFPHYDRIPNVETIVKREENRTLNTKLNYMFEGRSRNWKATLKYISNLPAADDIYKTASDFLFIMQRMYASVGMTEDPNIYMMYYLIEVNKIMNEKVVEFHSKP